MMEETASRRATKKLGVMLLAGVMVVSLSGLGLSGVQGVFPWHIATPTPSIASLYDEVARHDEWLIDLYKRVNPSVVHVRVAKLLESLPVDHPELDDPYERGVGSGFVFDTEGHIVTNNHVVDGAAELEITFPDGTIVEAEIVGTDPDSDLAVIRIDSPPEGLQAVELGDSDKLEVGQRAIAIGNPFGLEGTLTTGVVSALGRTLRLGRVSERVGGRFSISGMIQTDAAINPGNSGGPLLDYRGRVIGINTAINSNNGVGVGVGFAVPVNMIRRVVPKLIENGQYDYPWLGVTGTDLTLDHVKAMELSVTRGALVIDVVEGGPGDRAGLRGSTEEVQVGADRVPAGGDVIIGVDGSPVREFDDLLSYLVRETEPGQQVELRIIRDGQEQTVTVTLGKRPED